VFDSKKLFYTISHITKLNTKLNHVYPF